MSEIFTRIAAGHYRNAETGVEIVKVSSDEAGWGMGGWHVTVPARGASFASVTITATMRHAKEDAESYVRSMRETIAADFDKATAVVHHVTRYGREISCGATGPVRVEEVARLVTCDACVAADDARRMAEAERQAYVEDAERVGAQIVADVLADGRPLDERLQAKRDAAQVIAASRETDADRRARWGEVPADLDDDEAWAAYCAALPEPTDQQIADVLAEYGDPYAAARADAVEGFKRAARLYWQMRRTHAAKLDSEIRANLRQQMRTFRGLVEVFDQLTESWRVSTRTDASRDSYTVRWDDGIVTTVPYAGRRY